MNFETSDIQKQYFHITNEFVKSGTMLNDLLQMKTSHLSDANHEIPKYHEQFKDLAVPTGLIMNCDNSIPLQTGGCKQLNIKTDEDIITVDLFDKLFNNVIMTKKIKGSRNTKKNLKYGGKNKTKRSWF